MKKYRVEYTYERTQGGRMVSHTRYCEGWEGVKKLLEDLSTTFVDGDPCARLQIDVHRPGCEHEWCNHE
jgi:hypothetical protein